MRHEDAAPGAGGGQGLALINPTAPRVYPKAELENETTFDDDTRGQAASDPQGEARGLRVAISPRLLPRADHTRIAGAQVLDSDP